MDYKEVEEVINLRTLFVGLNLSKNQMRRLIREYESGRPFKIKGDPELIARALDAACVVYGYDKLQMSKRPWTEGMTLPTIGNAINRSKYDESLIEDKKWLDNVIGASYDKDRADFNITFPLTKDMKMEYWYEDMIRTFRDMMKVLDHKTSCSIHQTEFKLSVDDWNVYIFPEFNRIDTYWRNELHQSAQLDQAKELVATVLGDTVYIKINI